VGKKREEGAGGGDQGQALPGWPSFTFFSQKSGKNVVFGVKNVANFAQKWRKAANFCAILT